MDKYQVLGRIGEGAHGYVLHGRCKKTQKEVALKKVLVKKVSDGIPNEILREIKTLQTIENKYVMELLDFFPRGAGFVLVFDFMPSGLWEMLNDLDLSLTEAQVKRYIIMLLQGVSYLHKNGIMHRDLKPANLLIGRDGVLRIADFGQARPLWKDKGKQYTHEVSTRWYRAPELLYGSKRYNETIDLWAVGCIVAEALTNMPLFPGETDIDQLALVIRKLGTPTEENWPGVTKLPDYNKISFAKKKPSSWEHLLPGVGREGRDLVKSFIVYDSQKRISAADALNHNYFRSHPQPVEESELPRPPDDHRSKVHDSRFDDPHENEILHELDFLMDGGTD